MGDLTIALSTNKFDEDSVNESPATDLGSETEFRVRYCTIFLLCSQCLSLSEYIVTLNIDLFLCLDQNDTVSSDDGEDCHIFGAQEPITAQYY